MIGQNFDLDAQLVVSANDSQFVVVAQQNYIIVNFPDFKALESLKKLNGPQKKSTGKTTSEKKSNGGPLKKLQQVNDKILDLGLVVDVRVNNKTYIEFGNGKSAKIKAAALFGIIGSFFGK
ncbi:hypothetical protein I5M27_06680 [Adhaeribacter sp. BT258]|uniref:Uncharacterized protein n=1 Tax=Adhaeribacter terrigena TaxID=2793070 RepID=A0ABS1C1Z3_9BACT|nr:hypothetical protein [Adhaeribacter terrigena]MBK0402663.1 hypothetical protein [Adhaeribacter terrigena]